MNVMCICVKLGNEFLRTQTDGGFVFLANSSGFDRFDRESTHVVVNLYFAELHIAEYR